MSLSLLRTVFGPAPSEMKPDQFASFIFKEMNRISFLLLQTRLVKKAPRKTAPVKKKERKEKKKTLSKEEIQTLCQVTGLSPEELLLSLEE